MADYISREAVLDMAYWHGSKANVDHPYPDGVDAVDVSDIEKIPAADVEPVRAGAWIPISDGEGAECSECGEYYDLDGRQSFRLFCRFYRFCPACGAKMDMEGKK